MNKLLQRITQRVQDNKKRPLTHLEHLPHHERVLQNREDTLAPTDQQLRLQTMHDARVRTQQEQPHIHDLLYKELLWQTNNKQIDLDMTLIEERRMSADHYTHLVAPVYARSPKNDPWNKPFLRRVGEHSYEQQRAAREDHPRILAREYANSSKQDLIGGAR